MNIAYGALDTVDYETLGCGPEHFCNSLHDDNDDHVECREEGKKKNAESLQSLVSMAIAKEEELVKLALESLPYHFMGMLLRSALLYRQILSISILISEWPHEVLDLGEVVPELKESLFVKTMVYDTAIVMGLMRRDDVKSKTRLQCLDLRGFHINEIFARVIVGSLPLLSLESKDRNVDVLANELLQFLSTETYQTGGGHRHESLEEDMRPILQSKLDQFSHGYIYVPSGQKLLIKVDKLEFGRDNSNFMDFLIMGALRRLTPCHVQAYNLYIETNINDNERLIESCTPFLALLGQDPEILQGLSLNNLEDMLFQYILRGVARFTNLRALDIGNCSVSITGRTRVRVALRARIVYVFGSFTKLTRLDLRKSELSGSLRELLNALRQPLEYLNLSGCQLSTEDLSYLGSCKHSTSLKELHLSSLVRRGDITTPDCLLDCVERMRHNLKVLEIQNNELGNDQVEKLTRLIPKFTQLKMLDTLYNFMSQESLLRIVEASTQCPTIHCLAVNLLPVFGNEEAVMDRRVSFQRECEQLLHNYSRRDITLVVIAIGID